MGYTVNLSFKMVNLYVYNTVSYTQIKIQSILGFASIE